VIPKLTPSLFETLPHLLYFIAYPTYKMGGITLLHFGSCKVQPLNDETYIQMLFINIPL